MTQSEKIINYMKTHGSITARQAYHMGIMRLASRISTSSVRATRSHRRPSRSRTGTAPALTSPSIHF